MHQDLVRNINRCTRHQYTTNNIHAYDVRCDSTYAAGSMFMYYNANAHPMLAYIGIGLQNIARTRGNVTNTHVRAHDNEPWNELADRICKSMIEHGTHAFGRIDQYIVSTPVKPWTVETGKFLADFAYLGLLVRK